MTALWPKQRSVVHNPVWQAWQAWMTQAIQDVIHSQKCGQTPGTKLAVTWWLGGHHGRWGSYISVVIWRWWCKRGIDASRTPSHSLWLLLSLQLVHQTVHHVYTHRRGWVIIFIDRTSSSILITVYKHVQECLHREKIRRTELRTYLLKDGPKKIKSLLVNYHLH